ncbi:hypothetical protein BGC07_11705 [Piscirickettsia litoralis]|uniref:PAS domain-containing protein n=2 Tax=Piscirickettsia litoralis TaxID=1891921 RepID=A0ABX3A4C9_9GAMM|nr:hypothetical protein BGC07_11705 [Piscirickettsia litoralis]
MKDVNRIYCITNVEGNITFISESFLEIYKAAKKEILGKKINSNYIIYPLGSKRGVQDLLDLQSGKLKETQSEIISFNQNRFIISTIYKYPQMDNGKVIGIIHDMDPGVEQFKKNRCLSALEKASYHGIPLNRKEIKLAMILAHFEKITGPEIADILEVKVNSVYMYKSILINKIKSVSRGDDCCFIEVMRTILLQGLFQKNSQLICLPYDELVHSSTMSLHALKSEVKSYREKMAAYYHC